MLRPVPLLLVQGFACGKDDWGSLIKLVASKSKREVLTFDNRGIGGSIAPEAPYTVDAMAEDALSVVDAAGVDTFHVMGISLGGIRPEQTEAGLSGDLFNQVGLADAILLAADLAVRASLTEVRSCLRTWWPVLSAQATSFLSAQVNLMANSPRLTL